MPCSLRGNFCFGWFSPVSGSLPAVSVNVFRGNQSNPRVISQILTSWQRRGISQKAGTLGKKINKNEHMHTDVTYSWFKNLFYDDCVIFAQGMSQRSNSLSFRFETKEFSRHAFRSIFDYQLDFSTGSPCDTSASVYVRLHLPSLPPWRRRPIIALLLNTKV